MQLITIKQIITVLDMLLIFVLMSNAHKLNSSNNNNKSPNWKRNQTWQSFLLLLLLLSFKVSSVDVEWNESNLTITEICFINIKVRVRSKTKKLFAWLIHEFSKFTTPLLFPFSFPVGEFFLFVNSIFSTRDLANSTHMRIANGFKYLFCCC